MSRWSIIAAWLVLLVSALVVAVITFGLLRNERERIATVALAAAMEHAEAVAETISLAVTDVQDGLLESLRALQLDRLEDALYEWKAANPLVRNVFIQPWNGPLMAPPPTAAPGTEDARFLARYEPLFAGRIDWESARPEQEEAEPPIAIMAQPAPPAQQRADSPVAKLAGKKSFRQERQALYALSRNTWSETAQLKRADRDPWPGGWIPWIWENQLHILGWTEQAGIRYGLELELIALVSRLVESIPDPPYGVGTFALLDGQGKIVHQRGSDPIDAGTQRLASVQIGAALPHWQISIYGAAAPAQRAGRGGFALTAGLLVGVFIVAIVLGGSHLLWQAQRYAVDARQKTSFVSNVSHELKTPLTTIRMYAELLNEGRISDPDRRKSYLQVIMDESRRLGRLVNNVLDFSRLEQDRMAYHTRAVDVGRELHAFLEIHGPRIRESGMAVTADIPTGDFVAHVDRDAFEQIVVNLVDNALKYAAEGRELTLALENEGDTILLRVMDRGPGISAANRRRVFRRFHRVDDSLTARNPGAGLGLTIAQKLARDMHGDLVVEAREGGGAAFALRLPRAQPASEIPS